MTPRRRMHRGSISVGDLHVTGSAVAIGEGASASHTTVEAGQSVAGAAELSDLRQALNDVITTGRARALGTDARTIGAAIDHVVELDEEIHATEPRAAVVGDLLTRLTTALAGVAGISESMRTVVQVVGSVFGVR